MGSMSLVLQIFKVLNQVKLWPDNCATCKVRGSPNSVGYVLWECQISILTTVVDQNIDWPTQLSQEPCLNHDQNQPNIMTEKTTWQTALAYLTTRLILLNSLLKQAGLFWYKYTHFQGVKGRERWREISLNGSKTLRTKQWCQVTTVGSFTHVTPSCAVRFSHQNPIPC